VVAPMAVDHRSVLGAGVHPRLYIRGVSTHGLPGRLRGVAVGLVGAVALAVTFVGVSPGLAHGAGSASGRRPAGRSPGLVEGGAPATEVDPGPDSSVPVTTASDTMAATYGVAYLNDGETVLVGATDSSADHGSGGALDTDLQAAIVDGASVNTVTVPLPAGAAEASAFIGGAAVTALTNGDFAVLYWGSNESDGSGGAGTNKDLPDFYVQVFAPDGNKVGGLATLVDNGNEGNATGSIAKDGANGGFVVAANTDDETEIVVQRYTDAGATSGASLSFSGRNPFSTVVDSQGDIVALFEDVSSGNREYLFVPDGATATTSPGVIPGASGPTGIEVTTDPNGGFIGFELPESGSDLEANRISTSGALGPAIPLGDVGSTIAGSDFIWSAVTLSGGGYAMTLNPDSGNSITGYPALDQVITVGASLTAASTSVEDLTTGSGASAPVGPYAVADASGGIATYTDIPDTTGDISPAGYPLSASLSATTYLDAGPTVSAGATTTFTAGGPGVILDPTVHVTDASSAALTGATIAVGSGFLAGDLLSADATGTSITPSYDTGTGVLTLTGSDTIAHYQTVLDSVTYSFDSSHGDPTSGGTDNGRTVEWAVSDATTTSSTGTSTLSVDLRQQPSLTVTSTGGTFGTPLTLTTSGGSGTGAVSFTATDGTASGCTVSGSSLSTTSAGTCTVTATKGADDEFDAVSSGPATVTFGKASQAELTVTSTAGTVGTPLTLTTSGGSGTGAVSFTATDGTASGCTVSGTELTATSAGTCTVTATKAADADYLVASSVATTVTFAQATQAVLTVTLTDGTFGTPLTLTTSGGSGTGAVSFTATDGTAGGCTVSGTELTATSAGTCAVTATKAGDSTFSSISSGPTTVTFAKATQATLTVTSTDGTFGSLLTLSTSGGSGTGGVTFTATDGTASGCTVSGSSLSATSAGTCTVTATKAADDDFEGVSSGPATITFGKASQTIVFTSPAPPDATVGTTYEPSTSAGSGLPVTIALDGSSTGCTLSAGVVRFTGPGLCVLDATQAGDADWFPAPAATQEITVAPMPMTPSPTPTPTPTAPAPASTSPAPSSPSPKPTHKPKPKPPLEQHVTVRIGGLKDGATYFGAPPAPHCIARASTGSVECRIAREVTPTTSGTTVTYTANARGSAGTQATASVTVHIADLQIGGLQAAKGIYLVKLGNAYTLRVASRIRPLYVTAAVAPQPPAGTHDWFHRTGTSQGLPVWTLRLYLHTYLSRFPAWNLGIKIGDKTQVLTIRT
jgi:hypothetical protein